MRASTERVQILFRSGNFGLLILKWCPVLPGCGQGVHLATSHLQEDRGQEGLLWERERHSVLCPHPPSQERSRRLADDRISVQEEGDCPRRRKPWPGWQLEWAKLHPHLGAVPGSVGALSGLQGSRGTPCCLHGSLGERSTRTTFSLLHAHASCPSIQWPRGSSLGVAPRRHHHSLHSLGWLAWLFTAHDPGAVGLKATLTLPVSQRPSGLCPPQEPHLSFILSTASWL